ncbi:hypothetical protein NSK_001339 [Nannochloropsis salina CCMP1776]|uniref:Pyruvate kinase n=1 Tax=Nannochloropsis salina CCMP1776 TaxID=1027361 RepID=A0A4D9DC03_9STRA|nr:hypothetical protein NSK_001339 [Nannochloropsis salina CCMP1776]|eukprot:TFJ87005.1 hypothetical protein NSK_001339 [Nannochloropsis salina CCMP1776]
MASPPAGHVLRESNITLDHVLRENNAIRKSKIVCTLGPACWSVEGLGKLIDAGMNVARLNFSHGDHEGHGATLDRLREALATRPGVHVAVMLDTKGPEIRTGFLGSAKTMEYKKGSIVEIVTDYSMPGNSEIIACSYSDLPTTTKVGATILVADGSLVLKVTELRSSSVMAEVQNTAVIGERKNMNLPGAIVNLPTLTEKDVADLTDFGIPQNVDFIAASFVRKGSDIDYIRSVLGEEGSHIKIIAKIENQEGLHNYEEILDRTDGIMVARGDLGMEIPSEKVFLGQKMMINKANIRGKPVITATQMLESMIKNPRPTRAECTDVANAVLDGTDCVMLSGETANGDYPTEAVTIMAKICREAESAMNYNQLSNTMRNTVMAFMGHMPAPESVASSSVKTAFDIDAKMIVVLTETGNTAQLIAKYRPSMPILALTAIPETARFVQGVVKNSYCVVIGSMIGTESILLRALDIGRQKGWVESGANVVCVHGTQEAVPGSSNMLRVMIA